MTRNPPSLERIREPDLVSRIRDEVLLKNTPETLDETDRTHGREHELPIVGPDGRMGDVLQFWRFFDKEIWKPVHDSVHPELQVGVRHRDSKYFEITCDAGKGHLEIVLPPATSLHESDALFAEAMALCRAAADATGQRILATSHHPVTTPRSDEFAIVNKGRYHELGKALSQPANNSALDGIPAARPPIEDFGVTDSAQLHLRVARDEIVPALNTFNALAGPMELLFGNNAMVGGDFAGAPGLREGIWEKLGAENVGIPPRFASIEEYIEWLLDRRFLGMEMPGPDGGKVFQTFDGITLRKFLEENPEIDLEKAWAAHTACVWTTARFREAASTVESRVACAQPAGEESTVAALHLGLMANLGSAAALVDAAIPVETARKWREIAIYAGFAGGLPAGATEPDREEMITAAEIMLEIACDGLAARGLGEEKLLRPLRQRLEARQNPAEKLEASFSNPDGTRRIADAIAAVAYPPASAEAETEPVRAAVA